MIERLMSFDGNADHRISRDELPERMQGLVARGDKNADAALDSDEIRALVNAASSGAHPRFLSLPAIRGLAGRHQRPEAPAGKARARACDRQRPQAVSACQRPDQRPLRRDESLLDDEEYENFVAAAARLSRRGIIK